jgi:hypothetical protein
MMKLGRTSRAVQPYTVLSPRDKTKGRFLVPFSNFRFFLAARKFESGTNGHSSWPLPARGGRGHWSGSPFAGWLQRINFRERA